MAEDIEGRDSNKRTRLHRALLAKDFQIAKKLVERGADVRARDRHGWEPLHALAHLRTDYLDILSPSPFVEMIQVLLDAGADVNALDSFGDPPLYHAYLQHSSLIFRLLADVGADMSRLERHIGVDACQFLTRVLHPLDDTADLDLLPMGVDVNAIHSRGYTLLGRAVWLGSPSAVKALLRRGADPTVRFPLHHAFNLMQHPDGAGAINALIDAGADASKRPLNRAVLHCCPPAFRVIFAKRGRVSKPDFHFSDRLLHAPEGADMVVDLIEDGEIKRDAIPRDSTRVVLHCAIQRRSLRAIRRLLELAEDPGDHGNTPFHYSAELLRHPGGRQGLLALEKEGGLINATNKDGKSPLQLAIQKASRPAVRFLLEQGADPHTVGTFGAVPALFVLEMLKHHTGVHSLLKLVCAGMTVKNAPPHPVSVRSRPRCLDLIHEVRKIMVSDVDPFLKSACLAFLSSFYSLLESYPPDLPLHECEISLVKEEKCGEGGFSDCFEGVFLGRHKVAMKVLRAYLDEEDMERRMEREKQSMNREMGIWSKLNHPNILPFIGWYTLGPKSYMVSPWMEEGDALAYVKRKPQADRLQLLVQIADGLRYLHTGMKKPVIHGDLKAANIFISNAGVARIADFGLSEFVEGEKPPRYSTEWYCAGSTRWQAPELLRASAKEEARRTKKTDSFAYGRVMLELFTGQLPFSYLSDATRSIFEMVLDGQLPERPLDKDIIAKGLDDNMWELMKSCWSVDPNQRPSAAAILDDLEAALRVSNRGRPDDDSDFESSANLRPEKRARITDPPVKLEVEDVEIDEGIRTTGHTE